MRFFILANKALVSLAVGGLFTAVASADISLKTSLTRSSTVSQVLNTLPGCAVGIFLTEQNSKKKMKTKHSDGIHFRSNLALQLLSPIRHARRTFLASVIATPLRLPMYGRVEMFARLMKN